MEIENFKKRLNFYNILKSNSNNIETDDFINEWEFENYNINDDLKCICGHNIINTFSIKNILNNKSLIVGSDCIKKFMINNEILKDTIDNIIKAQLYIKKYSNTILLNTKFNEKSFDEVYNINKNYIKFIKELDNIKNPILRKFKNYIIYQDLLKKYKNYN